VEGKGKIGNIFVTGCGNKDSAMGLRLKLPVGGPSPGEGGKKGSRGFIEPGEGNLG